MNEMSYEQHCLIKFCLKLSKNATETLTKFKKAYGDDIL